MDCSMPGFPIIHYLPEFVHIHIRWVGNANHFILCHPLLLWPSVFPIIRIFPGESALHNRWPKYWSFNFSINLSKEYSGLVSVRTDLFHLLVVQGTLKSLFQNHNSKHQSIREGLSLLYEEVQLSYPYMTTRKTIALTIATFGGKVISLCFNMLSKFVIAFLPRSKHLLISRLQSPPAVIWEFPKIKSVTASTFCFVFFWAESSSTEKLQSKRYLVFYCFSVLKVNSDLLSDFANRLNSRHCTAHLLTRTWGLFVQVCKAQLLWGAWRALALVSYMMDPLHGPDKGGDLTSKQH